MTTTTTEWIEKEALETAEGIGKVGRQVSHGIHHAVMAGGEPARQIADVLHGTWLGHPLHVVLTDVTVGAWTMGVVFDGIGALTDSNACRKMGDALTIAGTISAVPTALSGLADFSTIPEPAANTATLHAMTNTVSVGLYAWSIAERRRGRHTRGAIISASAFGLTLLSAWLGGHMVYTQRVGVNHAEPFDEPEEWTPVLDSADLPPRTLKRVDVDGKGVLLYRDADAIHAIGSVCSHAGGPLQEGEVQGHCVQCPWHDSVFDLRDGHVVHGPATQPQPRFEAREWKGQIEIRLPKSKA
jgi:nitrite reductase/ring-hydroxylating ferredoxin subunit/uncharacterized membrane protein